mmetsp:Transcript_35134/g.109804  ORF Transcript_35134/g.109804 Transcript_35134/m.109804 type:complete len:214 (+) Transcript_35134:271-912(+)
MLMDSCSSRLHLAMLLVEISMAGEPSRIVDWSFPLSSLAVHSLAMARSTLTVLPDASKCSVEKPAPGRYSAPTCISSVEPTSPFVSPAKSEGGSLRTLRSAMATRRSPLRMSGRSSAGPPCTTLVITICPSTRFSNSMPSHPGAFLPSLSCFPSTLEGFQFGTFCLINFKFQGKMYFLSSILPPCKCSVNMSMSMTSFGRGPDSLCAMRGLMT